MKIVSGKLGKMRKPQEFVVMPSDDGMLIVQSDKSIGKFDPETGEGVLNVKGTYFMHLNECMGAAQYQFPTEFVEECKAACIHKGEELATGIIFGSVKTMKTE